jgi:integrase
MTDGRRGSVKQAPNGTWLYVMDVPSTELGPNGKPKRKQTRRRGFKSRRDAQAALTTALRSLAEQTYIAPKRETLAAFLTDRWLPAIEHTIRPGTFESYRRNVRLHLAGRPIGAKQLQDVTGSDLNALYRQLLAGDDTQRPLSARSVKYIATIAHRAFKDAVRWNAIVRNPVDQSDPPRQASRPEMTTWSSEQVTRFLEETAGSRLWGAWWLLAATGMRRGEVLGLRWADVDLDEQRIKITRTLIVTDVERKGQPGYAWGTPKTEKGRRVIRIDDDLVAALRAHRARQLEERMALGAGYADEDLVVCGPDGGPQHPKRLSYYFEREGARLGLPRIRLHDLRHSYATAALEAGISARVVQEMLGHAHVSVTLGIYSHVSEDLQADAAARMAELRRRGKAAQ